MSSDAGDLAKIVLLLGDRSSAKRSSAAKKHRKLAQPEVCHQVLQALRRELEDEQTWEIHYQMVMALAESGCRAALPFLQNLSHRHFEHSMVLTAIGDALVRLDG